jgi:hypothetical protein
MLGRTITPGEVISYEGLLSGGASRFDVAFAIIDSTEGVHRLINGMFQTYLQRPATSSELSLYTPDLQSPINTPEFELAALLIGSDEYFGLAQSDCCTSATVDWGDDSDSSAIVDSNGAVNASHTYREEGSFGVVVSISDLGTTTTVSETAQVVDAALTGTGTSFSVKKKKQFAGGLASFTDANPAPEPGDFTATISWGDGGASTGTVAAGGSSFTVNGSHIYRHKGVYPVVVAIHDTGGAATTVVSIGSVK